MPVSRTRAAVAGAVAIALVALTAPTAFGAPARVQAELADGTLLITGTSTADRISVRLGAPGSGALEVLTGLSKAPEFRFRRSDVERIRVEPDGGADAIGVIETNGVFTDTIPTTVFGGDDGDRFTGGSGGEVFVGGAGTDTAEGRRGADTLLLGSGDDSAFWSVGDGADTVEGQTGSDTAHLVGSSAADHLELTAAGSRIRAILPDGPESVDLGGIDTVSVRPAAGGDTTVVNDLTGSAATSVVLDLGSAAGGASDGVADEVVMAGTPGADTVSVTGAGGQAQVTGLGTGVEIVNGDRFLDTFDLDTDSGSDSITVQPSVGEAIIARVDGGAANDTVMTSLTSGGDSATVSVAGGRARVSFAGASYDAVAETTVVNGLGGNDNLRSVGNLDPITRVVLDGGDGTDLLTGDVSAEILLGGAATDQVVGHGGDDVLHLGDGADVAFWTTSDGDDIVEGGTGQDFLTLRGGDAGEQVTATALGARVRLQWAAETLDLDDVETTTVAPLRGTDTITVDDLSGTDLLELIAELESAVGSGVGDGQQDRVRVNGTNGVDNISVGGVPSFVTVGGLHTLTRVRRADFPLDPLTVDTRLGVDTVSTSALAPGSVTLTVL